MKSLHELLTTRKSIRSFRDEPIARELINEVLSAGLTAPTNCNQQLWNFIVIDDRDVKDRLVREAASNTLLRRAPVVIVVTYDAWNKKEAVQGAALAVGYMLLRAHDLGIGSLPMNSYGGDKSVKRVLGIPDHEKICCFVLLGYPDERSLAQPPVPRRPLADVVHNNMWESRIRPSFSLNPEKWTLETLAMHQQYFCRKTVMGKEMDIMSQGERDLVRSVLADRRGDMVDYLSFDGSLLREFPQLHITTLDTAPAVSAYTRVARKELKGESHVLFSEKIPPCDTATLLFKAERIPHELFVRIAHDAYTTLNTGGEFILISRTHNVVLTPFFWLVRLFFGSDTRRTGIFTWFGPYRLVRRRQLIRDLRREGFTVSWSGYQFFPSYFERVYQMMAQYIRSEGSSYLHREERNDVLTRALKKISTWQGMTRFGVFGGIMVIHAHK